MTTVDSAQRSELQQRTVRTLMVAIIPAGMAMSGGFSAASVLGEDITGSKTLGGLAASCVTVGSAFATVPLAQYMDTRGRRPGLAVGWMIGLAGAALALAAVLTSFYPLLPLGALCIGVGSTANLTTRYAAVDLVEEDKRARTIGIVVWAGTFGSVLGPTIALGWAGRAAEALGLDELAGPYILSGALFAVAIWWINRRLHPDPLVAAGGLHDHQTKRPPVSQALRKIWKNPAARLAATAMVVGHAVMVGIMTMTPLHMKDGEHELQIIGFVISLHIIGMYAFSPVVGWLVDRVGPHMMIAAGGTILFVGAELASHTDPEDSMGVFIGLFLIGLGWSFGLVAGSSLLSGAFPVDDRVKIQGAGDLLMTGAGGIAGLSAGAVADLRSYHDLSHWAGIIGLALSGLVILDLLLMPRRNRQTSG